MANAPKLQEVKQQTKDNKKGKKRAPENETPRERFERVAGNRLNNALTAIALIGQVGLSNEYEYDKTDADTIAQAIAAATKKAYDQMVNKKKEKEAVNLLKRSAA